MLYALMACALFLALLAHEMAHAYAARLAGDEVAALEGRLSPNPLRHLDPFGTLVLPFFLALVGSPFLVGYAKPVRVHPANFRSPRLGLLLVASAGPAVNLLLAALLYPFADARSLEGEPTPTTFLFLFFLYNVLLAAFNLVPLPPLDGSNLARALLPRPLDDLYVILEPALLVVLVAWLVTGGLADFLRPLVEMIALRLGG